MHYIYYAQLQNNEKTALFKRNDADIVVKTLREAK